MRKTGIILLLAVFATGTEVQAQPSFFQQLKKINTLDRSNVAYSYTIQLYETGTRKVTDSITGKIYKIGNEYVDSSNAALVAVSGKYYCKIDHQRKEARVYDIELIQKKLNLKIDRKAGHVLTIPDSLLVQYGRLEVDTGKAFYTCRWSLNQGSSPVFTALIEKKTLRLTEVILETAEQEDGEAAAYRRSCRIRNIKNDIPYSAISLDNIFRISGEKVVLNSRYAHYNLKTIIQ